MARRAGVSMLAFCSLMSPMRSGTVGIKPDPSRKIDAAVAAVVAFERAISHAQPQDIPWVE